MVNTLVYVVTKNGRPVGVYSDRGIAKLQKDKLELTYESNGYSSIKVISGVVELQLDKRLLPQEM